MARDARYAWYKVCGQFVPLFDGLNGPMIYRHQERLILERATPAYQAALAAVRDGPTIWAPRMQPCEIHRAVVEQDGRLVRCLVCGRVGVAGVHDLVDMSRVEVVA